VESLEEEAFSEIKVVEVVSLWAEEEDVGANEREFAEEGKGFPPHEVKAKAERRARPRNSLFIISPECRAMLGMTRKD
jgi:hypothetical protein